MTAGLDLRELGYELRLHRSSRENIESKGRRYLIEGRLTVRHVTAHEVRATCRGTEQTWQLGYSDGRTWLRVPSARSLCPSSRFSSSWTRPEDRRPLDH